MRPRLGCLLEAVSALEVSLGPPLVRDLEAMFLQPATAHRLWAAPTRARLFRSWPRDGRQHHAADFLSFLRRQLLLSPFDGQWIAMSEGSLADTDSLCLLVLLGDLERVRGSRTACKLQQVIDTWHLRSGSAAFSGRTLHCTAAEQVRTGRDKPSKCRCPVSLPRHLNLPCWVEGVIRPRPFTLPAAIVHLGDILLVTETTEARSLKIVDVASKLMIITGPYARVVQENVYVVFFCPAWST